MHRCSVSFTMPKRKIPMIRIYKDVAIALEKRRKLCVMLTDIWKPTIRIKRLTSAEILEHSIGKSNFIPSPTQNATLSSPPKNTVPKTPEAAKSTVTADNSSDDDDEMVDVDEMVNGEANGDNNIRKAENVDCDSIDLDYAGTPESCCFSDLESEEVNLSPFRLNENLSPVYNERKYLQLYLTFISKFLWLVLNNFCCMRIRIQLMIV